MANVTLKNIIKNYGKVTALNDVSFNCKDREFFTILGPSGAGKTTTLKVIAGVEPISSGEVLIDNDVVNDLQPALRNVAMTFESYALYSHLTVMDNLKFPLMISKNKENIDKKVQYISELLNIKDLLHRRPSELSGGQKQRVALGRSLIKDAVVYLLDEPISHLDAKLKFKMRSELKKLSTKIDNTIIYVTHDYREAFSLSDRILILNKGMVEQIDEPTKIFNFPKNIFVADFIGDPVFNFLDGKIIVNEKNKYSIKILSYSIPIPERFEKIYRKEIKIDRCILGIHPHELKISLKENKDCFIKGEVVARIPQTNEKAIIAIEVKKGKTLQVKVPLDYKVKENTTAYLGFPDKHIHLFDPNSNLNLLHI